ncbi:MAG: outer membrane lipoprotein-sorting protein [Desulfobacteraceae bacterium]|jgi:outer membrane lipoprotein-sorting protein
MKRFFFIFILILIVFLHLPGCFAMSEEEKGFEIVKEADRRSSGYIDFTAEMRMILRNRNGDESERAVKIKNFEITDDGDKTLSFFTSPRDVKGTSFLTFAHKVGDDDQWLYLPSLKRVKRISSSNKSGSFMGSEFSYEDIAPQEVEKYTYKWIKDEMFNEMECFVIERYPVDKKNSGYSKQIVWIDKQEYRTLQVKYFDRKGFHLKTLALNKHKQFLDKFWRSTEMVMVNHQNGKSTDLYQYNYKFQVGLKENEFSKNGLKSLR